MASRGISAGNQSDEEQDIDIESDDDDLGSGLRDGVLDDLRDKTRLASFTGNISDKAVMCVYIAVKQPSDKKAHHNALERKRRDHIKESFVGLRDCLPTVRKEKVSRAQILQQATEYIQYMTKKNNNIQKDIDAMRRQNQELKQKVLQEKSGGVGGGGQYLSQGEYEEDGYTGADIVKHHHKRLKTSLD